MSTFTNDISKIALVNTAGYGSDCNLSALVPQHAMKPYRCLATMELIEALQLTDHVRCIVPPLVTIEMLEDFHAETYVANLGCHNTESWFWNPETSKVFFSGDCPPVEGIVEHSLATASGTLMGAVLLNSGKVDIAMHWGGGMHHTKCGECSGFCYVNDIVIGILELLKCHERVLYIDLDMHHGDGVDEAFCQSDRVFTLSLHKFGESFFPGTGAAVDVGVDRGEYYTMNLNLWDGINDFFYTAIFQHALREVVSRFSPDVIVLQCGADSLAEDRIGLFNLSSWGHGCCVEQVRNCEIPMLVVGGGGYTIRNVAKLWAYETGILCGHKVDMNATIPIEKMPCTGWLFEGSPYLHVPQDESSHTQPGWNSQRAYQSIIEQIDANARHIKPHPRNNNKTDSAPAGVSVKVEKQAEC
ncbi:histone deacetylase 1/2 [Angomonas deanei]|uniref:Histone deacetylase n=1 Tax=Angomonas deanei TaxID=59799 RepID=A0A7G2CPQ7_9TRYP|nr:histone deacetylase 1/2 [Angomonas deanei]CAD2220954.1 Histone deacetylase domain containing protein, putative [Angomonas deanei]|eukprot:EPY39651.1 histone deacetylase 1/2 [Angomonas deanei]